MNLSAFYELRERLRTAAIAGTALMGDDFRLRRAVEQLAPLEQASQIGRASCRERVLTSV